MIDQYIYMWMGEGDSEEVYRVFVGCGGGLRVIRRLVGMCMYKGSLTLFFTKSREFPFKIWQVII